MVTRPKFSRDPRREKAKECQPLNKLFAYWDNSIVGEGYNGEFACNRLENSRAALMKALHAAGGFVLSGK